MSQTLGKVYLVGAGPGHPDYLTIRAQYLISKADVIIYDALISEEILQNVSHHATLLYVGKRGGQSSTPQNQINQLLVAQCHQGKQVVRLKSGDPFIFGRITEEIIALSNAECAFEIVPGISSALAAPLLAGIPLTDPIFSSCFVVVSGHEIKHLHWEAITKIDTIVVLMGGANFGEIINQVIKYGKSIYTPVAVIRSSSHAQEKIWVGELGKILSKTAGETLSPSVIVIGNVVKIGYRDWFVKLDEQKFMDQPLLDKTILVTRAAGQSSSFISRLESAGAKVIEMPALEIGPPSSWQELDTAISQINEFDWLILTSSNGVDYFWGRLKAAGKDARALGGLKVAVVGEKTAKTLLDYHLEADFIPPNFVADALVENFPENVMGKRILFPRVETGGREVLVKELTNKGAQVMEVAAYESRCPEKISPLAWQALQNHRVDVITFASSKTVQNFYHLVEQADNNQQGMAALLKDVCLASIGPQTSKTCQELWGRVDVEAQEYTMDGLFQSLIDFYC